MDDNKSLVRQPLLPATSTVAQWADFYASPDDYSTQTFTSEEMDKIKRKLKSLSSGSSSSLPLRCAGATCPFSANCTFVELDKAPLGKTCLIEGSLLREWTIGFIMEYGVSPDSLTDRILVQELAELELILYRVNSILSLPEHGNLMAEENICADRQGNIISKTVVNGFLDLKLKIGARKDKIIKMMVGDRQEKYKKAAALKQRDEGSPSSSMAEMRKNLEKLKSDVGQLAKIANTIDVEVAPERIKNADICLGELLGEEGPD